MNEKCAACDNDADPRFPRLHPVTGQTVFLCDGCPPGPNDPPGYDLELTRRMLVKHARQCPPWGPPPKPRPAAGLSRDRRSELQRQAEGPVCFHRGTYQIKRDELLSLLSMAERAVSEETVRKLAHTLATGDDADLFSDSAMHDLRAAADALRGADGG